jgi:hypothetical protein
MDHGRKEKGFHFKCTHRCMEHQTFVIFLRSQFLFRHWDGAREDAKDVRILQTKRAFSVYRPFVIVVPACRLLYTDVIMLMSRCATLASHRLAILFSSICSTSVNDFPPRYWVNI